MARKQKSSLGKARLHLLYDVDCPFCGEEFEVEEGLIGEGSLVRCGVCLDKFEIGEVDLVKYAVIGGGGLLVEGTSPDAVLLSTSTDKRYPSCEAEDQEEKGAES